MPAREGGKGIGAEQQHQWSLRPALIGLVQTFEGRHGVACPGGLELGRIDCKTRVIGSRQPHHRQPLPGSHLRRPAQCRLAGRNPAVSSETETIDGLFGEAQMPEMNRVKGAAKQA